MKFVSILGLPGSGKGTLCKKIVENYNCKYLQAGDLLRNSNDISILKIINSGELVPSEIICELLIQEIKNDSKEYQFILLDGFPRSFENLKYFETHISNINMIIHLDIEEEMVFDRLLKRKDNRKDDIQNIIQKRINVYNEQTKNFLSDNKIKIIHLDASLNHEEVFNSFILKFNPDNI